MSEPPERPAQPGVETSVAKDVVAAVQDALDSTFNATADAVPSVVEEELRRQLDDRGVLSSVTEGWLVQHAGRIAAGEPVVAVPGDA